MYSDDCVIYTLDDILAIQKGAKVEHFTNP